MSNSAFIGLVYCPSASISVTSQYVSEARTGGMIANTISFTGSLPDMTFNANYAPVPPASRITS